MSSIESSRVVVLVKALPQPSKTYGETVCCAGVTDTGQWKRLFPVRFRQLGGEASFRRWDWINFKYRAPRRDHRRESCHVFEDSIQVDGRLSEQERTRLLNSILVGSADEAMARGCSLALIRPSNTRFIVHHKRLGQIEAERAAYERAANQTSMFDKELAELEPAPVKFYFRFDDASGSHRYENGDWETHAMFRREKNRSGEAEALRWMEGTFNEEYPRKGMAFAIGNQAKRPQVWQLLGVIRLDASTQGEFSL